MGVSKNRGTPKWMVIMENPIKMDDFGIPLFSETSMLKGNESSSNHQFSADMFGFQAGFVVYKKSQ